MLVNTAVAVAFLTGFVACQTTANSTIDASTVSSTTKSQWCLSQRNVCGTLCSGEEDSNECDPSTLAYTCTCASNSSTPGLVYYTGTLPTFICEQIFQNCIAAGENDQAAQAVCTRIKTANCGTLDPEKFVAAAVPSSSAYPTSTPTGSPTPAGTATSTMSKGAGATLMPGQTFGLGAMVMGAGAAFGYLL